MVVISDSNAYKPTYVFPENLDDDRRGEGKSTVYFVYLTRFKTIAIHATPLTEVDEEVYWHI